MMAHTEFLQGEITERFLPATGAEDLSGEDGQVAYVTWLIVGLFTAGVVFVFFTE
jgi:hypothetical protein